MLWYYTSHGGAAAAMRRACASTQVAKARDAALLGGRGVKSRRRAGVFYCRRGFGALIISMDFRRMSDWLRSLGAKEKQYW